MTITKTDWTNLPTINGGEVRYQYEYKNNKGKWFDRVYVAQEQLISDVVKSGLEIEILMTDECDQYLSRITGF